ncbi:MAG: DUF3137 domain-containing protein [Clostridia bacterium]|nr:DUF3137 domain-containing protein [Clostridia bacterium]
MISREEFRGYVDNLINDKDRSNLKSRRKIFSVMGIVLILAAVACLVVGLVKTFTDSSGVMGGINAFFWYFLAFGFFVIGFVLIMMKSSGLSKLAAKYKSDVIEKLLEGYDFSFDETACMPMNKFVDGKIVTIFDEYEGEDLLVVNIPSLDGNATDVNFAISDVKVQEVGHDSNGGETRRTLYNGSYGYITFPKRFKCQLTLNRDNYRNGGYLDRVSLEDIMFSREFSVRTSDQVEARYILTPDLMLRLLELKKRAKKLGIVLDGRRMYISMPQRTLFEAKHVKDTDLSSLYMRYYDDVEILLSIINEIQQNDKVFTLE